MDNYGSCSNYRNEMDRISVVLMGAIHSGNNRVAERAVKVCTKIRKDIVIQQQAKQSRMQAVSRTMRRKRTKH